MDEEDCLSISNDRKRSVLNQHGRRSVLPLQRRFLDLRLVNITGESEVAGIEVGGQDGLSFGAAMAKHDVSIRIVRLLIRRLSLKAGDVARDV